MHLRRSPTQSLKNRTSAALLLAAFSLTPALSLVVAPEPALAKRKAKATKSKKVKKPEGPLVVVISLGKQRLTVFDKTGALTTSRISSGKRGHRTPTGVFSILQKRRRHYSNLYAGASMPNMQRITWSGVAMHAGHLPGYPASHGCIRLPYGFSKRLFGMTSMGTRVVVTHGQPVPRQIAHTNLIKPLPPGTPEQLERLEQIESARLSQSTETPNGKVFGIATARADGTLELSGLERTRASVALERLRQLDDLEGAVVTNLKLQREKAADLKQANFQLSRAYKDLKKAKKALTSLTSTMSKARKALRSEEKKLGWWMSRKKKLVNNIAFEKAEAREIAFENALIGHEAEYDMAAVEAGELRKVIAKLQKVANDTKELRIAKLRSYNEASKDLSAAKSAFKEAQKADARRDKPITVLVSRKKQELYVRQGYDDVFSAPIEFEHPDMPIGTHVYVALEYSGDGANLDWTGVTASKYGIKKRKKRSKWKRRRKKTKQKVVAEADAKAPTPRPAQTLGNALDRVKFNKDLKDRLAELIKPGSTLIISDHGISNETGKYTDLIVSTR